MDARIQEFIIDSGMLRDKVLSDIIVLAYKNRSAARPKVHIKDIKNIIACATTFLQDIGVERSERRIPLSITRNERMKSIIDAFIDGCCLREPGIKEKSSALYGRFVDWYHANVGEKEPSITWFGKMLSQKFEKSKSEGCIVYHGIGPASDHGEYEGY